MEQTTQTPRRRRARPKTLNWRPFALAVLGLLLAVAVILRLSEQPPETVSGIAQLHELAKTAKASVALPAGYHRESLPDEQLAKGNLVLVNRDHSFDPESVTDLIAVYPNKSAHYEAKDWLLSVDPQLLSALNRWIEAGYEKNAFDSVNVVAGYRSYETQKELYDNAVSNRGEEYAQKYINLPGTSEHHTGLAVDLSVIDREGGTTDDFIGAGKQTWLREHAWEYGLVLRYPPEKVDITGIDFESWHYRYVGLPHAQIMTDEELCLEEYIDYLRQYPFEGDHLRGQCMGNAYEIYYCPSDSVILPDNAAYSLSGNNVDGYIVTIYAKKG